MQKLQFFNWPLGGGVTENLHVAEEINTLRFKKQFWCPHREFTFTTTVRGLHSSGTSWSGLRIWTPRWGGPLGKPRTFWRGWPKKASVQQERRWSGHICLCCCPWDPNLDKWKLIDGWSDQSLDAKMQVFYHKESEVLIGRGDDITLYSVLMYCDSRGHYVIY